MENEPFFKILPWGWIYSLQIQERPRFKISMVINKSTSKGMQVLNVLVQLMMKCATMVTFWKIDLCDLEKYVKSKTQVLSI
jgi:hypothetical protein